MASSDRLDGQLRIARQGLESPLQRLNGVLEHSENAHAKQARELLQAARRELERASEIEQLRVCRDCRRAYEREEMDVERVPQWGGKTFLCCPHCGSHKEQI